MQKIAIRNGDRVLMVDDWIETGSQARAAKALVETAHGVLIGTSVIVNRLPVREVRDLGDLHYLLRYFPEEAEGPEEQGAVTSASRAAFGPSFDRRAGPAH